MFNWFGEIFQESEKSVGKYTVLQANPNNDEGKMYAAVDKDEPHRTALFVWQEVFLQQLRIELDGLMQKHGANKINVISTDFTEHSHIVPFILFSVMKLPKR